jgi:hypothetical protein
MGAPTGSLGRPQPGHASLRLSPIHNLSTTAAPSTTIAVTVEARLPRPPRDLDSRRCRCTSSLVCACGARKRRAALRRSRHFSPALAFHATEHSRVELRFARERHFAVFKPLGAATQIRPQQQRCAFVRRRSFASIQQPMRQDRLSRLITPCQVQSTARSASAATELGSVRDYIHRARSVPGNKGASEPPVRDRGGLSRVFPQT